MVVRMDTMSEDERAAALALLRDPRLIERIVEDFARCGGRGNKQVGRLTENILPVRCFTEHHAPRCRTYHSSDTKID